METVRTHITKWLGLEFLKWDPYVTGSSIYEDSPWRRPYDLCSHVEGILTPSASSDSRANAIRDLRKAADIRIRRIDELYSLRKIPIPNKPNDKLEILGSFGLIRPMMLQRLIEIRNSVEHDDEEPPDLGTCQTFLELTWYFLKSTDRLVRYVPNQIICGDSVDDDSEWVEINFHFADFPIPEIKGTVEAERLSDSPNESLLCLSLEPLDPECRGRIFFSGEVRGSRIALLELFRLYFSLAS